MMRALFVRVAARISMASALTLSGCGVSSGVSSGGDACLTDLPTGSYSQSCTDCTMEGTVLVCQVCKDGSGGEPTAQIDTCSCGSAAQSQAISNQHGILTCGTTDSDQKCSMKTGSCEKNSDCTCGASCGVVA